MLIGFFSTWGGVKRIVIVLSRISRRSNQLQKMLIYAAYRCTVHHSTYLYVLLLPSANRLARPTGLIKIEIHQSSLHQHKATMQ